MRRRHKKAITCIATALGLASLNACTPHLSQQQCQVTHPYELGFTDGANGKTQRDLSSIITDCARFSINIKSSDYLRGWQAGVRQFCQPSNAYKFGVNGQSYNGICPADLSKAFVHAWRRGLRQYCIPKSGYNLGHSGGAYPNFCASDQAVAFRNAYDSGRRIYDNIQAMNQQIKSYQDQLNDLNNQINDKQRQIDDIHSELQSSSDQYGRPLNDAQRHDLMKQERFLSDDTLQIREQADRLQPRIMHLQDRLNRYRSRH